MQQRELLVDPPAHFDKQADDVVGVCAPTFGAAGWHLGQQRVSVFELDPLLSCRVFAQALLAGDVFPVLKPFKVRGCCDVSAHVSPLVFFSGLDTLVCVLVFVSHTQ